MAACVHHWVLEPDEAGKSEGRCDHCGASRVFTNAPSPVSGRRYGSYDTRDTHGSDPAPLQVDW